MNVRSDTETANAKYSINRLLRCYSIDLFTDTAAILNYLDLRSIMGSPRGMSTSQYTRSVFTRAFRANFSLSFPRKRLQWEKKIVVPCLDVIMIAFFGGIIQ